MLPLCPCPRSATATLVTYHCQLDYAIRLIRTLQAHTAMHVAWDGRHRETPRLVTNLIAYLDNVSVAGNDALPRSVVTSGTVEFDVYDRSVVLVILHDERLRLTQVKHSNLPACTYATRKPHLPVPITAIAGCQNHKTEEMLSGSKHIGSVTLIKIPAAAFGLVEQMAGVM